MPAPSRGRDPSGLRVRDMPPRSSPSRGSRREAAASPALAVLAALALVTAGCLGPSQPEEDGEDADHRPLRLDESAAELGLAGCGGEGADATGESRGAGWGDHDGDGDPDLYVACQGPNRLYRNDNGSFQEVAAEAGVAGAADSWGVAWGDADADGCLDLYVANHGGNEPQAAGQSNTLYRNRCDGTFEVVPAAGGASADDRSASAAWADADLDGDLDLYVANRGVRTEDGEVATERNRLYENRGNLTFEDVAQEAGVAGPATGPTPVEPTDETRGASVAVAWTDYDKDGVPDLFVADAAGVSPLYRNLGNGSFAEETEAAGLDDFGRDRGVAAGDVDGDKDPDLYVARAGDDVVWENRYESADHRGSFDRAEVGGGAGAPGWGVSLVDLDGDGDLDAVSARADGELDGNRTARRDLVLRNDGDGTFADVSDEALPGGDGGGAGLATAAADADGDGSQDTYVTDGDGRDRLYRSTGPQGAWLGLDLQGNRSTPRGLGALVHVSAGGDSLVREVHPGSGLMASDGATVYLGLGNRTVADTVEIFWPSGIRQVVHDIEPVNRTIDVEEEQTVKTSCPLLFGWNGTGYEWRGDVLGNAYAGWRTAPGDEFMVPDPTERIRFRGLEPRDGAYELRLLEALEEINYLDEVELTAVDHPADVEVLPDERFNLEPPHDDLGLVQAGDPEPVEGAWLDGEEVTDLVVGKDGRSPDVPRRPAPEFDGYAREHTLTLDLGDRVADAEAVQLLVDGWIYYPMVIPDLAVEGPYVAPDPPSVEAYDPGADEWVPVRDSVGVPAGTPKQMTADLTGDLPDGATRIRLTTNLQVHWDRIRVDTRPDDADVRVTSVDPSEASLSRGGYPIYDSDGPQEPGSYDYEPRTDDHVWQTPAGNYTGFGEVTPLLEEADDKFAIFRHGDEVRMRFPAEALPDVPEGWERTVFVDLDGFFKDMEKHNAYPETVEPLPFHGMSNYPPGPDEAYPDDGEHREYRQEWNTRQLGDLTPSLGPGADRSRYIE